VNKRERDRVRSIDMIKIYKREQRYLSLSTLEGYLYLDKVSTQSSPLISSYKAVVSNTLKKKFASKNLKKMQTV